MFNVNIVWYDVHNVKTNAVINRPDKRQKDIAISSLVLVKWKAGYISPQIMCKDSNWKKPITVVFYKVHYQHVSVA